ncbi:lactoylglutathione lyase family protein [Mycolicibacterium aurum]|uniref:Lactoylglutathione lyase family protein n=1 Tax=Mycolicibacterium aurum TaxID=1791 RepID=A0A3S4VXK1_MYCAU|nr:VOC family protein [Mycolicibacterium aurum]VEG57770.1 lactoylglutathione lyase family protein [Mycolicibacterium aurum]
MNVGRVVPIVTVDDIAGSAEQYAAVLGLDVVMDHGWIVTLADPEHRHQVSLMTDDATAAVNPSVSVEVDDVDAAYEAARRAGLDIVHPLSDEEWGVRRFFFSDRDGNVVNVLTHRR